MTNNPIHPITQAPTRPPTTVKAGLTPKRRTRPVVENDDYAAFTTRIIAAHARRIATGDIERLTDLRVLDDHVTRAIHTAVAGLRTAGYSWAEIGNRLHITRQAAQQRFGSTDTTRSTP